MHPFTLRYYIKLSSLGSINLCKVTPTFQQDSASSYKVQNLKNNWLTSVRPQHLLTLQISFHWIIMSGASLKMKMNEELLLKAYNLFVPSVETIDVKGSFIE